jgi:hypothetical protein
MRQCQDQSGSNAALSVGLSQDEHFNLGEDEQANGAAVRPWRKLEGPYKGTEQGAQVGTWAVEHFQNKGQGQDD